MARTSLGAQTPGWELLSLSVGNHLSQCKLPKHCLAKIQWVIVPPRKHQLQLRGSIAYQSAKTDFTPVER